MSLPNKPEDAPEHCPGTQSEEAGKAASCEGCPNQNVCATAPKGPDPTLPFIRERLGDIKKKFVILSGKGGVGKSTFTTMLGFALSGNDEVNVGLLDVDICGPSIPTLTGLQGESIHSSSIGWEPVPLKDNLSVVSIGFLLPNRDDPVIWRGAKKTGTHLLVI